MENGVALASSVLSPAFALAPGHSTSVLSKTEMRVCVTGGTGFIGRALTKRLLSEGTLVRALARPSPPADALASLGAEIISGDLADSEALLRPVEGAAIVYPG